MRIIVRRLVLLRADFCATHGLHQAARRKLEWHGAMQERRQAVRGCSHEGRCRAAIKSTLFAKLLGRALCRR